MNQTPGVKRVIILFPHLVSLKIRRKVYVQDTQIHLSTMYPRFTGEVFEEVNKCRQIYNVLVPIYISSFSLSGKTMFLTLLVTIERNILKKDYRVIRLV